MDRFDREKTVIIVVSEPTCISNDITTARKLDLIPEHATEVSALFELQWKRIGKCHSRPSLVKIRT